MTRARDISRRAALGTLALGAGGLVLAGPSPRRRARAGRGRVVVRYWEKWTGREGAAIQKVVDEFNESQTRILVQRVPVSDIVAKTMVAIAGGDPPDVVGLYSYSIPHFAQTRAVLAWDELGSPPEPPYADAVRTLLRFEGRQWAGVNTCYTLALYANRAHLRDAGLDPSFDDLGALEAANERLLRAGADGAIERAGLLPNLPGWWPYVWPAFFDASLFDEPGDRATCASAGVVAAFEWISRVAERAGRGSSRAVARAYERSMHSRDDPFISGRVSLILQGPWLAGFIRDHRPDLDYACVAPPLEAGLPDRGEPPGLVEADTLCVPRAAPRRDEAWEFVRYTQEARVQESLARDHAKGTPMRSASAGFARGHPNPFVHVFDSIARSTRAGVLPRTRAWKEYADLLWAAFDAVWNGAAPAAELERVRARVQSLLDQNARRRARRASR